jgi:hypothetical protein
MSNDNYISESTTTIRPCESSDEADTFRVTSEIQQPPLMLRLEYNIHVTAVVANYYFESSLGSCSTTIIIQS